MGAFAQPPLPIPKGAITIHSWRGHQFRGYLIVERGFLIAVHPASFRLYGGSIRVLPYRAADGMYSWRGPHGPRDSCCIPMYIQRAVFSHFDQAQRAGKPYRNDKLPALPPPLPYRTCRHPNRKPRPVPEWMRNQGALARQVARESARAQTSSSEDSHEPVRGKRVPSRPKNRPVTGLPA